MEPPKHTHTDVSHFIHHTLPRGIWWLWLTLRSNNVHKYVSWGFFPYSYSMFQRCKRAGILRVRMLELKWLRKSGLSVCVYTKKKMVGKGLNTADIKISPFQHMEMMEKATLFASPQMNFSQCCANGGLRHPTALCSTIALASRQPIEVFLFLNW